VKLGNDRKGFVRLSSTPPPRSRLRWSLFEGPAQCTRSRYTCPTVIVGLNISNAIYGPIDLYSSTIKQTMRPIQQLFSVFLHSSRLYCKSYTVLRYNSTASSTNPPLTVTTIPAPHTGSIKLLLLSRPRAKNALSIALVSELARALAPIASGTDTSTRALVIGSAVPGVFCAGADLKERAKMSQEEVASFLRLLRGTISTLEGLQIPTIAAMSGVALGGGLELALAADLRVIAPTVQLGLPETRLGIIPGAGGTFRLPRLVGQSRAMDIILTGRRVGAEEALQIGLANRIVYPSDLKEGVGSGGTRERTIDTAIQVAQEISFGGPIAVRVAKKVVSKATEEAEANGYLEVVATKDRDEALIAFKEKRKPVFLGE
jgi:methylglutaconyl-CoA hydratase